MTRDSRLITVAEFARMPQPPEPWRDELVRGELVLSPLPYMPHAVSCSSAQYLLQCHVRTAGTGLATARCGMIASRNPDSVVAPDAAYWNHRDIETDESNWATEPPQLVIEVVDRPADRDHIRLKLDLYLTWGVGAVWVVDPEDRSVTVYTGPDEGRLLHETAEIDGGDILPGFRCQVAEFFAE